MWPLSVSVPASLVSIPRESKIRTQSKSHWLRRGGGVQTESCFIKSAISSDICEDKNKICDPKKMF